MINDLIDILLIDEMLMLCTIYWIYFFKNEN